MQLREVDKQNDDDNQECSYEVVNEEMRTRIVCPREGAVNQTLSYPALEIGKATTTIFLEKNLAMYINNLKNVLPY